jgi:hypothetical protein
MVPMVAVVNFFRSLYHETKNKISHIGTAPTCGQKLHEIAIHGVSYKPMWREDRRTRAPAANQEVATDEKVEWMAAYKLFPTSLAAGMQAFVPTRLLSGWVRSGSRTSAGYSKSTHRFAMNRRHYHWDHEPCWYAGRLAVSNPSNPARGRSVELCATETL